MAEEKIALLELMRRRALREGEVFRLASGRESRFYFNLKPVLMMPQGARAIGALMLEASLRHAPDFVGGLALGAVPLAAAMIALSEERALRGFFIRKEKKDHGAGLQIEGLAAGESLEGQSVLILEDVTTSGGSALLAAETARRAGARVENVLTVIDREEGAKETLEKAGLDLEALFTARAIRG